MEDDGLLPKGLRPATRPESVKLERTKPYKAAAPEDTVTRIASILAGLDVPFEEESFSGEGNSFSCCLRIVDDRRGEPIFQTMGKGRTDVYARASAYGEMIERLQNLAFYMALVYPSEPETNRPPFGPTFRYYPDEKKLSGEELRRGAECLFGDNAARAQSSISGQVLGVPFRDMFGAQIEYLPFRAFQIIVGSNGMCSGNTDAEALIHGICEVFERHVLKQFFLSPFTPPEVPLHLFAGHGIHEDLEHMAKRGYNLEVKDCSLGLRLPVIGLLIRDRGGRYAFHLGADPSPVTALERCLTEMRQGGPILFKDEGDLDGATGSVRSSPFWGTQLHLNIQSYGGHWPRELFIRDGDYRFQGFEHPRSSSDELDLAYLLDIMGSLGRDLLVRDNSFLGFPAYHVYIPGMSEITSAVNSGFACEYLEFDRFLPVLSDPMGSTFSEREDTARVMERYGAAAPSGQFRATDYFQYFRRHPLAIMEQDTLRQFLLQPTTPEEARRFPRCFGCGSCQFADDCSYDFIRTLWQRVKEAMAWAPQFRNDEGGPAKAGAEPPRAEGG